MVVWEALVRVGVDRLQPHWSAWLLWQQLCPRLWRACLPACLLAACQLW